jgi:hypothetical protein
VKFLELVPLNARKNGGLKRQMGQSEMKTRTHFAYRIELLNAAGEIQEHWSPADQLQALRHIR